MHQAWLARAARARDAPLNSGSDSIVPDAEPSVLSLVGEPLPTLPDSLGLDAPISSLPAGAPVAGLAGLAGVAAAPAAAPLSPYVFCARAAERAGGIEHALGA
jgi:hypothetical protein